MVPQKPVVAGESFSVQYIIEDADKVASFIPPSFPGFRLVSGPGVYNGTTSSLNQVHHVKNMVYTLEAINPGRFLINGATLQVDHSSFKSNSVFVQVISKEEGEIRKRTGDESAFVLLPGEDPYQKIKQNLFLKVDVDKQLCRVGEPVVATFKLYSRLQSKSDIVKNPGFYGFTVFDMINLADKISGSEKLNGKMYDVHVLRKVQLYPLQAGTFQVDPMQLTNKVEFSKSSVNRKTEQQIIEGMFGNDDPGEKDPGTEVYETSLSSEPVTVTVKALPDKNKTKGFDAAVGKFSINTHLLKNNIHANEEGILQVVVTGKGNFTQLNAPEIKWPEGIEVFDPVIKDSLDKMAVPLAGNRLYTYRFVAAKEGHYEIPAVQLSYFNTDTNRYVCIAADPEPLTVAGKIEQPVSQTKEETSSKTVTGVLNSKKLLLSMIGLLMLATVLVYFLKKNAKKKELTEKKLIITEEPKPFSAGEWF
ncbi:MAG: protein BatD, partial [Bacteroidetes bacterium]|nr:protein BatD [Bacteroidota bacterium]